MEHYKKETGKVHSLEQFRTLLVNDEKLKDPKDVANAFNNFFKTITEKLNIQQHRKEMLSLLGNFPSIKIIPITEPEIKSTIHSLKPKSIRI